MVAAKAANISLPIFAGDALSDYMLYEQLAGRPSLINTFTSTSVSPGSREFVQAYSSFTGSDPSTNYQAFAAHAYDAVTALLRAYQAAAAPKDGAAVKAQLDKLDFQGERLAVLSVSRHTCQYAAMPLEIFESIVGQCRGSSSGCWQC